MREIDVSIIDPSSGLATFSLLAMKRASGIKLLVAKVYKKLLSSSFATGIFTYYGLDLQKIPYYNISDSDIGTLQTMLGTSLQNVAASIQENTSKNALPTEQLASLTLQNILYDSVNNLVTLQIQLYPVQGDPQSLLFPLAA